METLTTRNKVRVAGCVLMMMWMAWSERVGVVYYYNNTVSAILYTRGSSAAAGGCAARYNPRLPLVYMGPYDVRVPDEISTKMPCRIDAKDR